MYACWATQKRHNKMLYDKPKTKFEYKRSYIPTNAFLAGDECPCKVTIHYSL